jgi:hypothetical protein
VVTIDTEERLAVATTVEANDAEVADMSIEMSGVGSISGKRETPTGIISPRLVEAPLEREIDRR